MLKFSVAIGVLSLTVLVAGSASGGNAPGLNEKQIVSGTGARLALNPQPEPPGKRKLKIKKKKKPGPIGPGPKKSAGTATA